VCYNFIYGHIDPRRHFLFCDDDRGCYRRRCVYDRTYLTKQVKEETILFREDIKGLRGDVTREGFRFERFLMFVKNLFKKTSARSKKETKKQ